MSVFTSNIVFYWGGWGVPSLLLLNLAPWILIKILTSQCVQERLSDSAAPGASSGLALPFHDPNPDISSPTRRLTRNHPQPSLFRLLALIGIDKADLILISHIYYFHLRHLTLNSLSFFFFELMELLTLAPKSRHYKILQRAL